MLQNRVMELRTKFVKVVTLITETMSYFLKRVCCSSEQENCYVRP